jgi:hypothetical protein
MTIRYGGGSGDFPVYEPGTYDLEIMEANQKTAKSGNPQLVVKFQFVGGRYDGKTITGFYSLMESAGWRVNLLTDAAGIERSEVARTADDVPVYEFEEGDLLGCIIRADITVSTYEGKERNNINKEQPAPSSVDQATKPKTDAAPAAPASAPAAAAQAAPEAAPAQAGRFSRPARRAAGA